MYIQIYVCIYIYITLLLYIYMKICKHIYIYITSLSIPLYRFSKSPENAIWMREAEIKHCRLAMLAAAGWPLSELWHKGIDITMYVHI
jgi:hypothetical protein